MAQTPTTPTSPDGRPRPASRGFSFRSDKSGGSENRSKSIESPRDKAQRDSFWKGGSKANPNAAVTEAQPAVANITEESTLLSLNSVEHRDTSGNVIVDPDRSNPTRPRMERPLDTIRSFERAIDDGYNRRTSYLRQDSEQWDQENQFASRRSSYFGGEYPPTVRKKRSANALAGYENGPSPNRSMQGGGYYGGQQGYYNNGYSNGPAPQRRHPGYRMASDPQLYGSRPGAYHNYQQSYDTVNTGMTNGSDSTGPWANSTDPSSENSSIDKVHAMNKPMDPYGGYQQNGYNGTIHEEHGAGMYNDYYRGQERRQPNDYAVQDDQGYNRPSQNGYPVPNRDMYAARSHSNPQLSQMAPPSQAAPTKVRKPIPLGGSSSGSPSSRPPANLPPQVREEPEKRRSWLKRTFSRNK